MNKAETPRRQAVLDLGAVLDYLTAWVRVTATLQHLNDHFGSIMTTLCFQDADEGTVIEINVVFGGQTDVKRACARTLRELWRAGFTFQWHDCSAGTNDCNVNHHIYCRMRG